MQRGWYDTKATGHQFKEGDRAVTVPAGPTLHAKDFLLSYNRIGTVRPHTIREDNKRRRNPDPSSFKEFILQDDPIWEESPFSHFITLCLFQPRSCGGLSNHRRKSSSVISGTMDFNII
ncbi:hypothetical protein TNCV_2679761 [Trichonephila clavipes]|nr:hypothetical protein TNCV_2679761 [Trichonephila clavipes]